MGAIRQFEQTARLLEPDAEQQDVLFRRVNAYARNYLAGLAEAPSYGTNDGRALLDAPITEEGIDLAEALALLHDIGAFYGLYPRWRSAPCCVGRLPRGVVQPLRKRLFRLWLPLKVLGVAPFRAALSEKILLARYFHEPLQHVGGFEVGPYPDLSVVTYRYVPRRGDADVFNQLLIHKIQQGGRLFISSTHIEGRFMLRLAVSCFRTHLGDIDLPLDELRRQAAQLADR